MISPELDDRMELAHQLVADRDWEAAAALFEGLALDLRSADPVVAAQYLSQSADALWRDDRPVAAAKALRRALSYSADAPGRAMMTIQLAGVLADVGQLVPARDLAQEVLVGQPTAVHPDLAGDLLVGLLLDLGALDQALDMARSLAHPTARAYRLATVFRVRGRAEEAAAALAEARGAVPDLPATQGLIAALAHEAGEQALAAGELAEGHAAFSCAGASWQRAGRRSGALWAAAGLVRVQLQAGDSPLEAELSRALDYAEDRGLVMLRVRLLLVRGAVRGRLLQAGALDDLSRAVALSAQAEALVLEARARRARAALGPHWRRPGGGDAQPV